MEQTEQATVEMTFKLSINTQGDDDVIAKVTKVLQVVETRFAPESNEGEVFHEDGSHWMTLVADLGKPQPEAS